MRIKDNKKYSENKDIAELAQKILQEIIETDFGNSKKLAYCINQKQTVNRNYTYKKKKKRKKKQ